MLFGRFKRPSLDQSLTDLRVSILRTISDVWRDDNDAEHSKGNLGSCYATLLRNLMKTEPPGDFNKKLRPYTSKIAIELVKFFNPGKYSGKYRQIIQQANPENIKRLFYGHFGIRLRHPHFSIQFTKPKSHWNVYGDHQWTKNGHDSLYLSLPVHLPEDLNDPEKDVKYDGQYQKNGEHRFEYFKTVILTDYLKAFPHILGENRMQKSRSHRKCEFMLLTKDEGYPRAPLNLAPIDQHAPRDLKKRVVEKTILNKGATARLQELSRMLTLLLPVLWNNPVLSKRLNYALRLFNTTSLLDRYYTVKWPDKEEWKREWKAEWMKGRLKREDLKEAKELRDRLDKDWHREFEEELEVEWEKEWRAKWKEKLQEWVPKELSITNLHELSYYLTSLEGEQAEELARFDKEYTKEINDILRNHYGYRILKGVDIKFIMPEWQVFFQKKRSFLRPSIQSYRCRVNPGEVLNLATLEIPHRPEFHNTASVSMALSRYSTKVSGLYFTY